MCVKSANNMVGPSCWNFSAVTSARFRLINDTDAGVPWFIFIYRAIYIRRDAESYKWARHIRADRRERRRTEGRSRWETRTPSSSKLPIISTSCSLADASLATPWTGGRLSWFIAENPVSGNSFSCRGSVHAVVLQGVAISFALFVGAISEISE